MLYVTKEKEWISAGPHQYRKAFDALYSIQLA